MATERESIERESIESIESRERERERDGYLPLIAIVFCLGRLLILVFQVGVVNLGARPELRFLDRGGVCFYQLARSHGREAPLQANPPCC